MIGRKVKNPMKAATKAGRVKRLVAYIRDPQGTTPGTRERLLYQGSRGFFAGTPDGQTAEMLALAHGCARSKDPLNHYVLSWPTDEQPTGAQIEAAVTILLDEFGMQHHQAIYALHGDTDNTHLHLVLNRIDPETERAGKINRGLDIEALHRAVARIEHAQGWRAEPGARYAVGADGQVRRRHDEPPARKRHPAPERGEREHRTGQQSAERIGIEAAAPVIARATSWAQLHQELGALGIRYETKGSGAVLVIGADRVKASDAGRAASLAAVQKRLGQFAPPPAGTVTQGAARRPAPMPGAEALGWSEWRHEQQQRARAKATAVLAAQQRQEHERREMRERHRTRRAQMLGGQSWRGKGDVRNVMASLLAAEQAAEWAALRERQADERRAVREQHQAMVTFDQWRAARRSKRGDARQRDAERARLIGDRQVKTEPRDIRAYVGEAKGDEVWYRRRDQGAGDPAFIDAGQEIEIETLSDDTVLAAMQLARAKWGGFHISGPAEFQAQACRLAAVHGFRLQDPEQAAVVERLRQQQTQEPAPTRPEPAAVPTAGAGTQEQKGRDDRGR
jgi:hypothetical protein